MSSSIILNLGSLNVEFKRFLDPKFPRTRAIEGGKLEYAVSGNAIGDGPAFEQPHIWSFSSYCTLSQIRVIGAMYAESDHCRRHGGTHEITLIDRVYEYQERLPRSRAIAPLSNEIYLGSTHVSYYAQFLVWFTQQPEFDKAGDKYIAHLSFQETQKLLA